MNYGDCKYISVSIRTASDKALSNEALNIVKSISRCTCFNGL